MPDQKSDMAEKYHKDMQGEDVQSSTPPLTVTKPDLLVSGSDDEFRRLVHRLLAFGTRLDAVRCAFGSHIGLTGIQYTILVSIAHLEKSEPVGVKRIATHLSLSGAFVTIETNKLVKLDLLEKQTNPQDRRRVLLHVTDKGRHLLADLATIQCEVNDVLFGVLDQQEFGQLCHLVQKLLEGSKRGVSLADYITGNGRG